MKNLEEGLPVIIDDKASFSCFAGFAKGTIEITVCDNGSNDFPSVAKVITNLGSGSISITLSGNTTIHKDVNGIGVTVTISDWKCTSEILSFHIKAEAKKSIFSCKVLDRNLNGHRYDKVKTDKQIQSVLDIAKQA